MTSIKLLVVEDDPQDISTCRSTIERYQHEKKRKVNLVECKDVGEAFDELDNTFDGAIIDLRLGDQGDEGNQVIQRIKERQYRFPVAILTATPGAADQDFSYIGVFKKGESGAGFEDLLDRFWRIQQTGLTRILGGKGIIESKLAEVFWVNILPQISKWEAYGSTSQPRTENALLRHILNHLIQVIDEDIERYFPEEFYLHPPPSKNIRTGSILKAKENDKRYAILSPDCDLVVRFDGNRNTERFLLVEIVSPDSLYSWFDPQSIDTLGRDKKDTAKRALENNGPGHLHCLPWTDFFPLGFLNFRSVSTVKVDRLSDRFELPPKVQISPPFVKDIVARFSSYYARQGQPDIDFAGLTGS